MSFAASGRDRKDAASVLTSERNRFESHLKEQGANLVEAAAHVAKSDFRKARDSSRLALRSAEAAHAAYSRWLDAAEGSARDFGSHDPETLLKQA